MYFYQIEIGYHYIYTFGIINYLHVVLYALRTAQMQIETENYKT